MTKTAKEIAKLLFEIRTRPERDANELDVLNVVADELSEYFQSQMKRFDTRAFLILAGSDTLCECGEDWWGTEHDSQCPLVGQPNRVNE